MQPPSRHHPIPHAHNYPGYDLGSPVGTVITILATDVPLLRIAEQTLMACLTLLEQLCRAQTLLSSPHADVLLVAQLQVPQGEAAAEARDPASMVRDLQHTVLLPVRVDVQMMRDAFAIYAYVPTTRVHNTICIVYMCIYSCLYMLCLCTC